MSLRRVGLWVAVVALLVAQTLGLAHRVAHDGGPANDHGHSHVHGHGDAHLVQHADHDVAHALFADHEEASDCRLYDQLTHADILPALAAAVPTLLAPVLHLACLSAGFLARRPAPFEARGPPPSR